MNYISPWYYLLLLGLMVLYYIFPRKIRWSVLLAGSLAFLYLVCSKKQCLVVGLAAAAAFCFGILIEKAEGGRKKLFLVLGILVSLIMAWFFRLFFFLVTDIPGLEGKVHVGGEKNQEYTTFQSVNRVTATNSKERVLHPVADQKDSREDVQRNIPTFVFTGYGDRTDQGGHSQNHQHVEDVRAHDIADRDVGVSFKRSGKTHDKLRHGSTYTDYCHPDQELA